ncbi:helix-turn-helix domain-containing protein [Lactiplantibacillus plajomi]|uniref:Helix-turn-helix domain-containing protein n=1 Tax=Lactiplantibacillus plajomi TaxID=1457217 RepID=A0ABV6K3Q5_9LACO|nr:helix-turn-helix transcriptional regulator [Lactiplantibacillus plajomi]
MTAFGQTIHQIRLTKDLSQQAVYSGVVSRSFANRFERGQNDIAATKLFKILDNLGISADEFRFIHRNYQPTPLAQALLQVERYYQQQNFPALATWVREHVNSPRSYERLVASYGDILLLAYDHSRIALTKTARIAYDHLRQTKTWSLQELKFVPVLVPLLASSEGVAALPALTRKVEQNCQRYQTAWGDPLHALPVLTNYYGTLFQVTLNYHDYAAAKAIKSKLLALDTQRLTWDERLSRQLWLGIWALFFGDAVAGQQTLDEITALEDRFRPTIDQSVYEIIRIRTKQARDYRAKLT